MGVKGLIVTPSAEITASSTVADACEVMSQERAGAVPVVSKRKLCGIFTYRDLVNRVVLEKRDPEKTSIGDVMTSKVESLPVDGSYGDALRIMVDNDYTYLPIVREDGTLAGMLSLRELLEHQIDHLAAELDTVTQYLSVDGPGGD